MCQQSWDVQRLVRGSKWFSLSSLSKICSRIRTPCFTRTVAFTIEVIINHEDPYGREHDVPMYLRHEKIEKEWTFSVEDESLELYFHLLKSKNAPEKHKLARESLAYAAITLPLRERYDVLIRNRKSSTPTCPCALRCPRSEEGGGEPNDKHQHRIASRTVQ